MGQFITMSLIVIQEKQKKTKNMMIGGNTCPGRTHRPHNHHNHNGDLRMTMDRNRCSFLVNGADQIKLTRLVTSAHHSYSVLIIVSVHIPDSHGDLRSTRGDKLYASHAHLVGAS